MSAGSLFWTVVNAGSGLALGSGLGLGERASRPLLKACRSGSKNWFKWNGTERVWIVKKRMSRDNDAVTVVGLDESVRRILNSISNGRVLRKSET